MQLTTVGSVSMQIESAMSEPAHEGSCHAKVMCCGANTVFSSQCGDEMQRAF